MERSLEDKQKLQASVLWDALTNNPHLPRRPILSVNQQLNTANKRIISSINELATLSERTERGAQRSIDYINDVVGNISEDPELLEAIEANGGNVIKAIINAKKEIEEAESKASKRSICFVSTDTVETGVENTPVFMVPEDCYISAVTALTPNPGTYPVKFNVEKSQDYETWEIVTEVLLEGRSIKTELEEPFKAQANDYLRINVITHNNDAEGISINVETKK